MERKFENSVLSELRNYRGYSFNPMWVYEVLYDINSEKRTPTIEGILLRDAFAEFLQALKPFGNGFYKSEAFQNMFLQGENENLNVLKEKFIAVVKDFKESYNEADPYYSYTYAVLILSIILATPGYFENAVLYEFVHFCRKNYILNI